MKYSYILDSNVFIQPSRTFYSFDFGNSFWDQMKNALNQQNVFLIDKVRYEIKNTEDALFNWISEMPSNIIYSTNKQAIVNNYREVLDYVATCRLYTEEALRNWSPPNVADPWIIASAKELNATIITFEASSNPNPNQPSRKAKIPDVAKNFGLTCNNLYYFMRQLNFRL